ncbi:putative competence/damage-inducible CinA family protein [Lojkania enalia]|uniref:Competence/damage-inducible CinA family protein n=1 Tax=Lojkania enalia TaxID=147567 RepID=A0A9P4KH46_9PLEO|nr:putative competence/damage-inducible CinA family protein [Didymosphaeria enalia]
MSTFPPDALRELVQEVAPLLKQRKETISVAETAAGGLISSALLSYPGASGCYKGGLTLYTLESRIAFAGWTNTNLQNYTGPTPDIVAGLAEHTRNSLQSTYTVSESGTAGPTGGTTRNRTPGYVALAVASEKGTVTREVDTELGGNREANMVRFAEEALKLLRDVIKSREKL